MKCIICKTTKNVKVFTYGSPFCSKCAPSTQMDLFDEKPLYNLNTIQKRVKEFASKIPVIQQLVDLGVSPHIFGGAIRSLAFEHPVRDVDIICTDKPKDFEAFVKEERSYLGSEAKKKLSSSSQRSIAPIPTTTLSEAVDDIFSQWMNNFNAGDIIQGLDFNSTNNKSSNSNSLNMDCKATRYPLDIWHSVNQKCASPYSPNEILDDVFFNVEAVLYDCKNQDLIFYPCFEKFLADKTVHISRNKWGDYKQLQKLKTAAKCVYLKKLGFTIGGDLKKLLKEIEIDELNPLPQKFCKFQLEKYGEPMLNQLSLKDIVK